MSDSGGLTGAETLPPRRLLTALQALLGASMILFGVACSCWSLDDRDRPDRVDDLVELDNEIGLTACGGGIGDNLNVACPK